MSLPRVVTLVLLFAPLVTSQALPDLPEFPSPSPAASPSPLPSALADLIPTSRPTVIPPDASVPAPPSATNQQLPPPGAPASPVASQLSPEPSPSISPTPNFINENGECVRDPKQPRPKLGKSQSRYAVSVLISAAAVGVASILYSGVYAWQPHLERSGWRVVGIIFARLLTVIAVKISAALVASITKASPDDGALDASGAFLTWGTAIFTRIYYEGICMTLAALNITDNDSVWDDKLKIFLNRKRVRDGKADDVQSVSKTDTSAVQPDLETGVEHPSRRIIEIPQHIMGGRWERKFLLITAAVYFSAEIAVLVSNVLQLIGSFEMKSEQIVYFSSDIEAGQCPISRADAAVLVPVILLQCVYELTNQPSLVPILTVSAFCPLCRFPTVNKLLDRLRWASCVVLLLWVTSLLTLPLLDKQLQPFYVGGDISLFWFVFIAPPSYNSTSYRITATYTCLAAVVGAMLIYRISKSEKQEK